MFIFMHLYTLCASIGRFAEFWVDVSLGYIFFYKDKFEKLLDSGFEHTELWESKHIRSYSYYVHFTKFKKINQTNVDNIFKTFHD